MLHGSYLLPADLSIQQSAAKQNDVRCEMYLKKGQAGKGLLACITSEGAACAALFYGPRGDFWHNAVN